MRLDFCPHCAHLFNAAFNPGLTDYTPAYDNSLHFSNHFNTYARALASRLAQRYGLRNRTVVEIGCGKGDFLLMVCEAGENRGFGFDRSFDPARADSSRCETIHFVQDFFTPAHALALKADLVCCRHVLEHLADPVSFLAELRRGMGANVESVLYLEVPNALYTLRDLGVWDLIYEHCGYFTLSSLAHAVAGSGFDVVEMGEAFDGQFIYVEARPGDGRQNIPLPREHEPETVRRHAATFAGRFNETLDAWRSRLDNLRDTGSRPVIWGGGSKGVTFLNMMGRDCGIEYVVDLNPHKQGKYVAGTGQQVVPASFLGKYRPSDVIVMNPAYLREIAGMIRELGIETRMTTV
jgi:SAM-dependent methyltransferase